MINRRNIFKAIAAAPVVVASLPKQVMAEPTFNPVFNHACADSFCGVQTAQTERGFIYFGLRNNYPHETREAFYNLSSAEQVREASFPSMAFTIEKFKEEETVALNDPMILFKRLPKYTIENNVFNFNRISNKICKNSRRGKGNVLIYNQNLSEPPEPRFAQMNDESLRIKTVHCDSFDKNEYVMMYKGSVPYDAAIFKINTPTRPLYFRHGTLFDTYMMRFELGTYTNIFAGMI